MASKKHGRLKQNATTVSSETLHPDSISNVRHSVDLHGYRKDEAISKLTSFLEQVDPRKNGEMNVDVWVLVITGSGAHSHQGPVLRGAVEALFQKRGMIYTLLPGRASFMVNAASGIVLYEPDQPRDTKVVIADSESFATRISGNNIVGNSDRWIGIMKSSRNGKSHNSHRTAESQDDEARRSGKALQKAYRDQRNEEGAMKKALSMSLMDDEKEKEDEQELLRRAVSLSVFDNQEEMEEAETLQKVLQQSERDFELEDNPEATLLRALELSRNECLKEDDELLQALEQSMLDF